MRNACQSLPRPGRRGLTLIELLVVVGIVMLLVGLLMPVLSRARGAAQRTICSSNLRQIGVAFEQYSSRYNNRFPDVQSMPVDPHKPSMLDLLKKDLAGSTEIWRCPSDEEVFAEMQTSYEYFLGLFYALLDSGRGNVFRQREQLHQLYRTAPTMAVTFIDAEDFHPYGPDGAARNAVFLDGHVDWFIKPERAQEGEAKEGDSSPLPKGSKS